MKCLFRAGPSRKVVMVLEFGADAETVKKCTAKARQDGSDPDEGATI